MAHLDPELLSAYIDHELPAADAAAVERHLAACDTCRAEYVDLRALSTLVRELPVYLPKREIDLREPDRGGETIARIVAFARPLGLAAAILLIAFAGLWLLTDIGDDDAGDGDQISFSAVQPTPDGTEPARDASEEQAAEAEAPRAAMPAAPAVAATVAAEPATDAAGDSWLTEAVVAGVAVAIAGAAGWYRLVRSPGRRGTRYARRDSD